MTKPTEGEDSPPEVEARLAAAWAFLRGQARDFNQLMHPTALPVSTDADDKHLLLAAPLPQHGRHAGVGLVIDRAEAVGIAAAMFDVAPRDLSEADIDDACGEACNVMSACVVGTLKAESPVVFERPRHLPAESYQAISEASGVLRAYASPEPTGNVTLTVFDPLANPAPAEPAP